MLSWKEGGEEIGENIWSEEKNEMERMKIGIQSLWYISIHTKSSTNNISYIFNF